MALRFFSFVVRFAFTFLRSFFMKLGRLLYGPLALVGATSAKQECGKPAGALHSCPKKVIDVLGCRLAFLAGILDLEHDDLRLLGRHARQLRPRLIEAHGKEPRKVGLLSIRLLLLLTHGGHATWGTGRGPAVTESGAADARV